MFHKLKQFKELREQAKQLQTKLATEKVSVDSRWGKLQLTMDGNMQVQSLSIDASLLQANEKSSLEKDLQDLFNEGIKKIQKIVAQKMAKEGGLPNLSDLLK